MVKAKKGLTSDNRLKKYLPINFTKVLIMFIGILIVILVYANNRIDGVQNQQQSGIPLEIAEAKFPVQTLDLRETSWQSNKFSGSITNNGTQDIFNATIKLSVSKSKNEWIPEDKLLTIPYKIKAGETLQFFETMPSYGSSDWWSSNIVDAQYYNGEQVPIQPVPTPTVVFQQPTIQFAQPILTPTQIPTLAPNLGKKFALEFILKKIGDMNNVISAWQSQIENLRSQFQKTCDVIDDSFVTLQPEFNSGELHYPAQVLDPMIRENAITDCYRQITTSIKEINVKIEALVRERGEFERQALQLIAQ